MPIPTWTPGQILTAADVNSWFVPLAVAKPSTQSVTSSTVLVNDTALLLPFAANATYYYQLFLDYEAAIGGDFKWNYALPAGGTVHGYSNYMSLSGVAVTWNETTISGGASFARGNGAGNAQAASAGGIVAMSSTSGNFQVQWAQSTSSGTATIVHASSVLIAWRIA